MLGHELRYTRRQCGTEVYPGWYSTVYTRVVYRVYIPGWCIGWDTSHTHGCIGWDTSHIHGCILGICLPTVVHTGYMPPYRGAHLGTCLPEELVVYTRVIASLRN